MEPARNKLTVYSPDHTPVAPLTRLSARRRRNKMCIYIMSLGALNLLAYTLVYAALGGDAHNGSIRVVDEPNGQQQAEYFLRGHHIRTVDGVERRVSKAVWIYSYLHSISLPITCCAIIISMLVLARPHILATMRDGMIDGRTFITAFATVVCIITLFLVVRFGWSLVSQLTAPAA
jgi:hypothetical protein